MPSKTTFSGFFFDFLDFAVFEDFDDFAVFSEDESTLTVISTFYFLAVFAEGFFNGAGGGAGAASSTSGSASCSSSFDSADGGGFPSSSVFSASVSDVFETASYSYFFLSAFSFELL